MHVFCDGCVNLSLSFSKSDRSVNVLRLGGTRSQIDTLSRTTHRASSRHVGVQGGRRASATNTEGLLDAGGVEPRPAFQQSRRLAEDLRVIKGPFGGGDGSERRFAETSLPTEVELGRPRVPRLASTLQPRGADRQPFFEHEAVALALLHQDQACSSNNP